ncbi:hypothetical protein MPER_06821, partial [Moniliophthora perniciosa FA553]
VVSGNLLGAFLDHSKLELRKRARWAFFFILGLQGVWWLWTTVLVTEFRKSQPTYDWGDAGFGRGFALFLLLVMGFQLNYMYLYFVVGELVESEADVVRIAGLLRATESAAQAVSVGGTYLNFGLWAIALLPAWIVIRDIGVGLGDRKLKREAKREDTASEDTESVHKRIV